MYPGLKSLILILICWFDGPRRSARHTHSLFLIRKISSKSYAILVSKFWQQIGISDIQASSLAFKNEVEKPEMTGDFVFSLFFPLVAIENETAAPPNSLISSSQLIKH